MEAGDKFLFDRDFDDLAILEEISEQEKQDTEEDAETEEVEPEEEVITFSEEELNTQRQLAFEDGKQQGISETLGGIENRISDLLGKIEETVSGLFRIQEDETERTRREAISVASAIVEKLYPNLDREHGFDEIVKLTEETLESLLFEPKIVINVHDALAKPMEERLKEFIDRHEFRGEVNVAGDSSLEEGDCRIEWSNGETERSSRALLNAAQDVVAHNLESTPMPSDDSPPSEEIPEPEAFAPEVTEPTESVDLDEPSAEVKADEIDEGDISVNSLDQQPEEDDDAQTSDPVVEEELESNDIPEVIDAVEEPVETAASETGEAMDPLAAQMEEAAPLPDETPADGDQSSN